jgi:hypothetical protein
MSEFVIFTKDHAETITSQIDMFDRIDLVIRLNKVGNFVISGVQTRFDGTDPLVDFLALSPGSGIYIMRDGVLIFDGITTQYNVSRDESSGGYVWSVEGYSADCFIADRLIKPGTYPYATLYSSDKTGVQETVMKQYVSEIVSVTGTKTLTVGADLARGASVTWSARFDNMAEAFYDICGNTSMYWRVLQGEFECYQSRDLRAYQVFSFEAGNLLSLNGSCALPTANSVTVAGGGEGVDRVFYEANSDDIALYHRAIETFADRRDTTSETVMQDEAIKTLQEGSGQFDFTFEAIDVPNRKYITDWNIGDWVSVYGNDCRIQEISISKDSDGERIIPSASKVFNGLSTRFTSFELQKIYRKRLNYLERRL